MVNNYVEETCIQEDEVLHSCIEETCMQEDEGVLCRGDLYVGRRGGE